MPYKPKRAGKSTREMAKKRRRSAAWTAIIGIAGVVLIILLLKYSNVAGIGGIGVLVLLILLRVAPDWIEGSVGRKLKSEKRAIRGARAEEDFAVCAKFRPLASHGTPWRHSKILHRCDTRRHGRSDDRQRGRRRVF